MTEGSDRKEAGGLTPTAWVRGGSTENGHPGGAPLPLLCSASSVRGAPLCTTHLQGLIPETWTCTREATALQVSLFSAEGAQMISLISIVALVHG